MKQNLTVEEFHILLTQIPDEDDSQNLETALRRLTLLKDPQEIETALHRSDLLQWSDSPPIVLCNANNFIDIARTLILRQHSHSVFKPITFGGQTNSRLE